MAFVFRSDKPPQLNKPNPQVGPGIYSSIQLLTTSKSIMKTRYPKHTFLLAAWNLNSDKALLITWLVW